MFGWIKRFFGFGQDPFIVPPQTVYPPQTQVYPPEHRTLQTGMNKKVFPKTTHKPIKTTPKKEDSGVDPVAAAIIGVAVGSALSHHDSPSHHSSSNDSGGGFSSGSDSGGFSGGGGDFGGGGSSGDY